METIQSQILSLVKTFASESAYAATMQARIRALQVSLSGCSSVVRKLRPRVEGVEGGLESDAPQLRGAENGREGLSVWCLLRTPVWTEGKAWHGSVVRNGGERPCYGNEGEDHHLSYPTRERPLHRAFTQ